MKYLIASDLHGSLPALAALLARSEAEKADKLLLLGDLYYHGPRNPLPEGYAPLAVAERLNALAERLIAIKGNCDAEVDETISRFPFLPAAVLTVGGRKIFVSHGHRRPELGDAEIWLHGHTHVAGIWREAVLRANPGSPSLPKEGTPRGYLLLDDEGLIHKDLSGATLDGERFL